MKLIKNFIYLSGAEVVSKAVTFAAIGYLARILGPVGFGYIEFAGSVLLCAGLIVDQGFGPYGAREIAKTPERTSALFSEIVLVRFILAAIAYAAVLVFAFSLDRSKILTNLLIIYGLSLLGMPLLLQWVFQGHDQMGVVAGVQVLRQTVYAAVVFAFVRSPAQIWFVALAEVSGVTCAAMYGLWMYRHRFRDTVRTGLRISKQLFREGVPIGLSQVFWMVRMFGATVVMGLIASPQDVGFFGAAMRILVALHAFVYLYYFNLLPSLSRAWRQGEARFGSLIEQSLDKVSWVSLFTALMWVMLAPLVIVAVYGGAFVPAIGALQWLAGVGTVAALSGHYRFGLIAAGRQAAEMTAQVIGTAVAVVLLPLAYAQAGPSGAALALVIAEMVVWLSTWWWSRQKLGLRNHLRSLMRPAITGALATVVLFVLTSSSLSIRITVTALLVAACAMVLDRRVRDYVRQFVVILGRWFRGQLEKRVPEAVRW